MLNLIDGVNKNGVLDTLLLASPYIANMYPNINNKQEMKAVRSSFDSITLRSPSTQCIMKGFDICLLNINLHFADMQLLVTDETVNRTPNSSSCLDTGISCLDGIINGKRATHFQEYFCFGRYRDGCLVLQ